MTDLSPAAQATPDFRALCEELSNKLIMHCGDNEYAWDLIERAHDALATPPPEPPTDNELMALAVAVFEDPFATDKDYARAVLERWGNL
jgi:hypothetical protein